MIATVFAMTMLTANEASAWGNLNKKREQAQQQRTAISVQEAVPLHYSNAMRFYGLNETQDRKELSGFFKKTINRNLDPTVTPWCAGFVDAILGISGKKRLNTLWAKDFLKYGEPVAQPEKGDIVVLSRAGGGGHVGFFERYATAVDGKQYVAVLGGNTETTKGDKGSVKVGYFPMSQILGYRRP
jgi:uncharacterized protein (TIGR02594 family)